MDGGTEDAGEVGRDPFAVLARAAAACAAVEVAELTDGEVLHVVVGMTEALGQVEAALARSFASFRSRQLHELDRARSVESWLAARTELPHGRAKALVSLGRQLPACPHVEAALVGG